MFQFKVIRNTNPTDKYHEIAFSVSNDNARTICSDNKVYPLLDLGYGYRTWWETRNEGRFSARPNESYKILKQIHPKKGDKIIYLTAGYVFEVGDIDGFLIYTAPLIDDRGKVQAYIKFEEYYKD